MLSMALNSLKWFKLFLFVVSIFMCVILYGTDVSELTDELIF